MEYPNPEHISTLDRALQLVEQTDSFSGSKAREALQDAQRVFKESKKAGNQRKAGWALVEMAMVLRGQRKYREAHQFLEEARSLFSLTRDNIGLAAVYYELSYANRELERNALALEYGHLAVKMYQELGRTHALAWAYDNMSVVYSNLLNRHESLSFAKKARAIFLEFRSKTGLAWNACNLGNIYMGMGYYPQAEKFYSEALQTFTQMKNRQGMAWSLMGLGNTYRGAFRFDIAMEYLRKSEAIYKELDLKDRVGWCLLNQAGIKRLIGQEEEAMLLNKKAVQLFGPLRDVDGMGWSLFQVGQIFRDRGQYIKSWQTLREALNSHTDIGNRKGMAWAENDWGKTYLELSNFSQARECLIKAKVMAEQLDEGPLKVESVKNIARLHLDEGYLQKAIDILNQSAGLTQKVTAREAEAEGFLERARYYLIIGEIKSARYWVNAADTWIEKNGLQLLKPAVGIFIAELLAAEKKYDSARAMFYDTLNLAKKYQQRRIRVEAMLGVIQLALWKKDNFPIGSLLSQAETDVRLVSSRKLKAKFLLVKGLTLLRAFETFDNKFFTQGLNIITSAGLVVFQKQVLGLLHGIYEELKETEDSNRVWAELTSLLDKGPVDLHLVRPTAEVNEALPVSLII